METNEKLTAVLLHEAEHAMLKGVEQLQTIREGDLQALEQQVLTACLSLGRRVMEQAVKHAGEQAERPTRRDGECGHQQRLVSMRPRHLDTLMGKGTFRRASSQCVVEEKEAEQRATCGHGQALFDQGWGMSAGRTSPRSAKASGKLVARMT
jgi:hypothetical protein